MNSSYKRSYQIDRVSKKYLPVLIIFMSYILIVDTLHLGKLTQVYSYLIYGFLSLFSFGYFWVHRGVLVKMYPWISALYLLMVLYVIFACVKLYFVPSSIYFYQRLVCFCSFLSVGLIFQLMRSGIINRMLRLWWRFVPWITLLSLPFIDRNRIMSMLFFVFLFMMLADCLRKQLRFLTYGIMLLLSMFGLSQRMDYLLVLFPMVVFFMIRNKFFLSYKKSMMLYNVFMLMPVFFLLLAYFGNFNVLKFDSYIKGDYTTSTGENMKEDTRSFLYIEAYESALKRNYVLWGRTPGYGYDSRFVEGSEDAYFHVEGVKAQRNSEVFIVNMFTWCGVIGVVAWFAFFYWFGISTLKHTRNHYIRGLTIYVSMFWVCDWFHNDFTAPNLKYIMLFIIISICVQRQFQQMSDMEICQHFKRMLK